MGDEKNNKSSGNQNSDRGSRNPLPAPTPLDPGRDIILRSLDQGRLGTPLLERRRERPSKQHRQDPKTKRNG